MPWTDSCSMNCSFFLFFLLVSFCFCSDQNASDGCIPPFEGMILSIGAAGKIGLELQSLNKILTSAFEIVLTFPDRSILNLNVKNIVVDTGLGDLLFMLVEGKTSKTFSIDCISVFKSQNVLEVDESGTYVTLVDRTNQNFLREMSATGESEGLKFLCDAIASIDQIRNLKTYCHQSIFDHIFNAITDPKLGYSAELKGWFMLALNVIFHRILPNRVNKESINASFLAKVFTVLSRPNIAASEAEKFDIALKELFVYDCRPRVIFDNSNDLDFIAITKKVIELGFESLSHFIHLLPNYFSVTDPIFIEQRLAIVDLLHTIALKLDFKRKDSRPCTFEGPFHEVAKIIVNEWDFLEFFDTADMFKTLIKDEPQRTRLDIFLFFDLAAALKSDSRSRIESRFDKVMKHVIFRGSLGSLLAVEYFISLIPYMDIDPDILLMHKGNYLMNIIDVSLSNIVQFNSQHEFMISKVLILIQNHMPRLLKVFLDYSGFKIFAYDDDKKGQILTAAQHCPETLIYLLPVLKPSLQLLSQIKPTITNGPAHHIVCFEMHRELDSKSIIQTEYSDHAEIIWKLPNWLEPLELPQDIHESIIMYFAYFYLGITIDTSLRHFDRNESITANHYQHLLREILADYLHFTNRESSVIDKLSVLQIFVPSFKTSVDWSLYKPRSKVIHMKISHNQMLFRQSTVSNPKVGIALSIDLADHIGLNRYGLVGGKLYEFVDPVRVDFHFINGNNGHFYVSMIGIDPDLAENTVELPQSIEHEIKQFFESDGIQVDMKDYEILDFINYVSNYRRNEKYFISSLVRQENLTRQEHFLQVAYYQWDLFIVGESKRSKILEQMCQKAQEIRESGNAEDANWAEALIYYLFFPHHTSNFSFQVESTILLDLLYYTSKRVDNSRKARQVFEGLIRHHNLMDLFARNLAVTKQIEILEGLAWQILRSKKNLWCHLTDYFDAHVESIVIEMSKDAPAEGRETFADGARDALFGRKANYSVSNSSFYGCGYAKGLLGPDPSNFIIYKDFLKKICSKLSAERDEIRSGYLTGSLLIFYRILKNSWKFLLTPSMVKKFWTSFFPYNTSENNLSSKSLSLAPVLVALLSDDPEVITSLIDEVINTVREYWAAHSFLILETVEFMIQISGIYVSQEQSLLETKEQALKTLLESWKQSFVAGIGTKDQLDRAVYLAHSDLPRLLGLWMTLPEFLEEYEKCLNQRLIDFWAGISRKSLECLMQALDSLRPSKLTSDLIIKKLQNAHHCVKGDECQEPDHFCIMKSIEIYAAHIIQFYSDIVINKTVSRSEDGQHVQWIIPGWYENENDSIRHNYMIQAFLLFTFGIPLDASYVSERSRENFLPSEFKLVCNVILDRHRSLNSKFAETYPETSVSVLIK